MHITNLACVEKQQKETRCMKSNFQCGTIQSLCGTQYVEEGALARNLTQHITLNTPLPK